MSVIFGSNPLHPQFTTRQPSPWSDTGSDCDDELSEIAENSTSASSSCSSHSTDSGRLNSSLFFAQHRTPPPKSSHTNHKDLVRSLYSEKASKIDRINQAFHSLIKPYQVLQNATVSEDFTLSSDNLFQLADTITLSRELFNPPPHILPHMIAIANKLQHRAERLPIYSPKENLLALSKICSSLFNEVIEPIIPLFAQYKHEAENQLTHFDNKNIASQNFLTSYENFEQLRNTATGFFTA